MFDVNRIQMILDPGEGLYAKTDAEAGDLLALFNGIRKRECGTKSNFSDYKIGLNR